MTKHHDTLRVILFGTGAAARNTLYLFSRRVQVLAVADNDPRKHGTTFMRYPVIAAADIPSRPYDCIVIASMYAQEIQQQLLALGVDESRIEFPPVALDRKSGFPWGIALAWTAILAIVGALLRSMF
jgi:hypothetical protein